MPTSVKSTDGNRCDRSPRSGWPAGTVARVRARTLGSYTAEGSTEAPVDPSNRQGVMATANGSWSITRLPP